MLTAVRTGLGGATRLRKVGWGLADQSLSSVSNFGALLLAGRMTNTASFGIFSILYALYILILGGVRGLVGDSFIVSSARADAGGVAVLTRNAIAFSVALGAAVGAAVGLVATVLVLLTHGEFAGAMLCLAVVLPGLIIHESLRLISFGLLRPRRAFVLDLLWVLVMVGTGAVLVPSGTNRDALWAVLWWGGSGALVGSGGYLWARRMAGAGCVRDWWQSTRTIGVRFTIEAFAERASAQVPFITVALIGGAALGGVVRGASLLRGPLTIFVIALPLSLVPLMAQAASRGQTAKVAFGARVISLVLFAGSLIWFGSLAGVPGLGSALYGSLWKDASPLILLVFFRQLAAAYMAGPLSALRSMGLARYTSRIRLMELSLALSLSAIGCVLGGARGVYVGLVVASTLAAFAASRALRVSGWRDGTCLVAGSGRLGHGPDAVVPSPA